MKVVRFDNALLAVWAKAAIGSVEIPCGSGEDGRKKATRLRYRLYDLRKAMERENHELYAPASQVSLRIIKEANQWTVVADASDQELLEVLNNAGFGSAEPPQLE